MKRDMDLIRTLLLMAEEECGTEPLTQFEIEGYEDQEIYYHIELILQAGFVVGGISTTTTSEKKVVDNTIRSVTWEGHELLDMIRDPTIWDKTKTRLGDSIESVGVAIILDVAKTIIKETLGLE